MPAAPAALAVVSRLQDEDLFVHTFGIRMLDLPGAKPVKAALQALAVAEEQLEQRVAAGDSSSISINIKGSPQQQHHKAAPQSAAVAAAARGGDGALSGEQAAALLARIRFRRLLLEALQSLQLYSQAGIEQARRLCQLAEAQLDMLAGSARLAAPLEEAPSFVPDVNRRHMGMVPPRPLRVSLRIFVACLMRCCLCCRASKGRRKYSQNYSTSLGTLACCFAPACALCCRPLLSNRLWSTGAACCAA